MFVCVCVCGAQVVTDFIGAFPTFGRVFTNFQHPAHCTNGFAALKDL